MKYKHTLLIIFILVSFSGCIHLDNNNISSLYYLDENNDYQLDQTFFPDNIEDYKLIDQRIRTNNESTNIAVKYLSDSGYEMEICFTKYKSNNRSPSEIIESKNHYLIKPLENFMVNSENPDSSIVEIPLQYFDIILYIADNISSNYNQNVIIKFYSDEFGVKNLDEFNLETFNFTQYKLKKENDEEKNHNISYLLINQLNNTEFPLIIKEYKLQSQTIFNKNDIELDYINIKTNKKIVITLNSNRESIDIQTLIDDETLFNYLNDYNFLENYQFILYEQEPILFVTNSVNYHLPNNKFKEFRIIPENSNYSIISFSSEELTPFNYQNNSLFQYFSNKYGNNVSVYKEINNNYYISSLRKKLKYPYSYLNIEAFNIGPKMSQYGLNFDILQMSIELTELEGLTIPSNDFFVELKYKDKKQIFEFGKKMSNGKFIFAEENNTQTDITISNVNKIIYLYTNQLFDLYNYGGNLTINIYNHNQSFYVNKTFFINSNISHSYESNIYNSNKKNINEQYHYCNIANSKNIYIPQITLIDSYPSATIKVYFNMTGENVYLDLNNVYIVLNNSRNIYTYGFNSHKTNITLDGEYTKKFYSKQNNINEVNEHIYYGESSDLIFNINSRNLLKGYNNTLSIVRNNIPLKIINLNVSQELDDDKVILYENY